MRWLKLFIAVCIVIVAVSFNTAMASGEDIYSLKTLIYSYDDSRMDSRDLAFFLVTHNYDAAPVGSYVQVRLDGSVYKLVPNGNKPGLADIEL